jgi:NAD(P)-dependent dehydrogenase (short-subunit alcohol dehydrogenase family)
MKSKNILITGTTSGFGKLAVQQLLKNGHRVIAGIRGGEERLKKLFAEELAHYPEGALTAIDLHLDRTETFAQAREAVELRFGGRLDVLINNAGFVLLGAFETQTPEQVRRQFEVNFFGPTELTRQLLPALRAARGRVLNVSSVGGRVTIPYYGTYTATKHALEAHTEGLRYELAPFGIQVGLIEPGAFRTDIVDKGDVGQGARDPESPYYGPTQAFEDFQARNFNLGGNPIRVARLIARLTEVRRVPIRSLIGPDARLLMGMRALLPENLRVRMMSWLFHRFVARPRAVARPEAKPARLIEEAE